MRYEVINTGYGLDILIHDKEMLVRKMAETKKDYLRLSNTERNLILRLAIARQGYNLQYLTESQIDLRELKEKLCK